VTAPTAKLEVAGSTKLGTDGVSFSSMGGCVIASTAISTTGTIDSLTCNTTVANAVAMTWNCMWMKI
jgi:hypothetical protein